ncbi:hypothetical protein [Aeromicrobium sp. UC242_57]|uniref:hypothetical protein n=1 Tax=Aeromicrobium sp. UC242_57 TaxID=3374624 RepID=UPI00379486FA
MTSQIVRPAPRAVRRGIVDLGDVRRGVYGVWIALAVLLLLTVALRPALASLSSLQIIAQSPLSPRSSASVSLPSSSSAGSTCRSQLS